MLKCDAVRNSSHRRTRGLWSSVVVPHVANALESLVIRNCEMLCSPNVVFKVFDTLDNDASFHVERKPVRVRTEGSAADIRNVCTELLGFLLASSAKAVDEGVVVHGEQTQPLASATMGAPK